VDRSASILIVDDEAPEREGLAVLLKRWGYETEMASDGEEALGKVSTFDPMVVISDLRMPGMGGMELLKQLRDAGSAATFIILTGQGSIEEAVEATKLGAYNFLEKPLDSNRLQVELRNCLQRWEDERKLDIAHRRLRDAGILGSLIGQSKPMQQVLSLISQVAPAHAPVLITGESGTGKELAARTIHELSPRSAKPFVAVNCAAIPESLMESEIFGHERGAFTGAAERRIGCFELADCGTLLLDEIGEMPAPTQAKLLRVLEDRKVRRLGSKSETPVDVRVLAATNKEPEAAVSSGQLRQDLYFRLNVFHIHLPPLREHKDDIPLLVEHILRDVNAKHGKHVRGIGAEVLDIFLGHTWPGNIRELRNVLERAAIMCEKDLITRTCLPGEFGKVAAKGPSDLSGIKFPVGTTVDAMERELILQTLGTTGNNKTRAAEMLGISLKTLHNKLKEYGGERAETE
jgi:DNA-binding NtrC family response regulator